MATYKLKVAVDPEQLAVLKGAGYKLCVARKVMNTYNVIWEGKEKFGLNNVFEWEQKYKVGASEKFTVGALVHVYSNQQNIEYKQICAYDSPGIMKPAKSDSRIEGNYFTVDNNYENTSFAVSCSINGVFSVIYTTPIAIVGETEFQPKNEVRVWFGQRSETSTMIATITGEHIDVPYGDLTIRGVFYNEEGRWELVE